MNYVLSQAPSGIPFQVSLAVPEIESIFLQDKSLIEKIAKRHFHELEWQLAQSKPKDFLETVLDKKQSLNDKISRWAEKFITMSWLMQQRGIKQSQGFQVTYILLHTYIYLCLPTYLEI
jgi:hypothetical protein